MTSLFARKKCAEKDCPIFPLEISSVKQSPKTARVFSDKKCCTTCTAPKNGLPSALQEGVKKANPREAHNQGRTKNCTTIVVLPSPRSLFSSIEQRLDCRFPSAARQRNQSRLKQTITTPIQDESIRQPDADVNSLSTYTRPSAGSIEAIASNTFKNHLKSLIDLLLVPCSPLVDVLWFCCMFLIGF